jgi:hypothetical protein
MKQILEPIVIIFVHPFLKGGKKVLTHSPKKYCLLPSNAIISKSIRSRIPKKIPHILILVSNHIL